MYIRRNSTSYMFNSSVNKMVTQIAIIIVVVIIIPALHGGGIQL